MSATTQVKVSSPEIIHVAQGQGFHFLEASIGTRAKGERVSGVPGSKSVAGSRTAYVGTWENRNAPKGSRQGAGKAVRRYGVAVVGLAHSRGVAGAMPGEGASPPEGASGLTLGREVRPCHTQR